MRTAPFAVALFLDCLARATPPCLYGAGACLLLGGGGPVLAAATAVAALLAAAAIYARATPYTEAEARAWLDRRNRAGGRIMAGDDPDRLRVTPGIKLSPFLRRLPLPAAFLIAAWLIPPAPDAPIARDAARLVPTLDHLDAEVAAAEEEGVLDDAEADALRRHIQELRAAAESHPEAALEAAEAIPARLDAARHAAEDAAAAGMTADQASDTPLANAAAPDAAAPQPSTRLRDALANHAVPHGSLTESTQGIAPGDPARTPPAASELFSALRDAEKVPAAGTAANGPGDESGHGAEPSRGPGSAPLWIGTPSPDEPLPIRLLSSGGSPGDDVLVARERTNPDGDEAPSPRHAPARSAVDAPDRLRAGDPAAAPGPARQRAVERYFTMERKR